MVVCRTGCLLEGVSSQGLPPYRAYQASQPLEAKEGAFLVCQGLVGFWWWHNTTRCILEVLGPGDFIVWERERVQGQSGCEVCALEEVRGRWLDRVQWLELLRRPPVQERFLEYTRRRWQRQHEWQLVLAYGSVRARVAWRITDLAQRFGEQDKPTGEIFVPVRLTQEQQAQLVGATRTRVVEALREFERKRWLVCGHEGFWVRNEGALLEQSLEGLE